MTDTITLPRSVVEQALEALNASMPHNNDMNHDWPSHIAARRALRAALEQGSGVLNQCDGCMQGAPLRGIFHTDESGKRFMTCQKRKYTHPQPPRQPLTDEEVQQIWRKWVGTDRPNYSFTRAIERAHGIGGEA